MEYITMLNYIGSILAVSSCSICLVANILSAKKLICVQTTTPILYSVANVLNMITLLLTFYR